MGGRTYLNGGRDENVSGVKLSKFHPQPHHGVDNSVSYLVYEGKLMRESQRDQDRIIQIHPRVCQQGQPLNGEGLLQSHRQCGCRDVSRSRRGQLKRLLWVTLVMRKVQVLQKHKRSGAVVGNLKRVRKFRNSSRRG